MPTNSPNIQALEIAQNVCYGRWNNPFPTFTSGQDARTSDNGLLLMTYGNLNDCASSEWLNSGRSLIDKTYLRMLQHVQALNNIRTFNTEAIARELDNFIREDIKPIWHSLSESDDVLKNALVNELVQKASLKLFGSLHSEIAASRILFFLCPMLPVFNYSSGALQTLNLLGNTKTITHYPDFHKTMFEEYSSMKNLFNNCKRPIPFYGKAADLQLINQMLKETDWWQRRVFHEYLLQILTSDNPELNTAFGCKSDGKL